MVIYDLKCQQGHQFEGWFPSIEAFETQIERGLVQCQVCGDPHVTRLVTGGHFIGKPLPPATRPAPVGGKTPVAMGQLDPVTLIKAVRHYVKSNFEDVGNQFTDLARQMARSEIDQKNICGQATIEEQKKLAEEEIPFFPLPELPPEFDN